MSDPGEPKTKGCYREYTQGGLPWVSLFNFTSTVIK